MKVKKKKMKVRQRGKKSEAMSIIVQKLHSYILHLWVIYRGSQQTIADRPTDQQTNGELIEFR